MKKKISKAAEQKLRELREEYKLRNEEGDAERLSQLMHMARSLKQGKTYYIYDIERHIDTKT